MVAAGVSVALHLGKLSPAIPALQASLGLSLVEAGFMLSLVQFAGMTLGLVVGLAADTIGLRRSMLIGLAVTTAASVLGGAVGHFAPPHVVALAAGVACARGRGIPAGGDAGTGTHPGHDGARR